MCSQLLLQISSCSCVHSCTGFVNCYKEGESSWYSNSSYSRSFGRCDFTFSCSLNQPFSERKEKKHFQHFLVVVRLVFLSSSPDPSPTTQVEEEADFFHTLSPLGEGSDGTVQSRASGIATGQIESVLQGDYFTHL